MTPQEFKEARIDLGFTQSQLAKILGMSDSRVVRRWESGERNPNEIACKVLYWLKNGHLILPKND